MVGFVDEVRVEIRSGRGGDGVTSFARQPFEPRGRPDGGDGGRGGDVIARADPSVATLVDYHHRPHRRAGRGVHGSGDNRRGADGADEVLLVPPGTRVRGEAAVILADLYDDGDEVVLAPGGRGGRGNAALRTGRRRAPHFHELGEPATELTVHLELRLAADVALLGFPSAGKSSLVAALSAARPKIADYPFTTLAPNLGLVREDDRDFVVADVPGLIEGASQGRGLGHTFLRHVERATVLVHVLDCASWEQRDPTEDLDVVLRELDRYEREVVDDPGHVPFASRPALVWLNKVDADREVAEIVRPDLEEARFEVMAGSAVTGEGLVALRRRLAGLVEAAEGAAHRPPLRDRSDDRDRVVLRPASREAASHIRRLDDVPGVDGVVWSVDSDQIRRWVAMTVPDNDEALRYLQQRLERAGLDALLWQAGARPGDAVEVAGRIFDFEPRGPHAEPEPEPEEGEQSASPTAP